MSTAETASQEQKRKQSLSELFNSFAADTAQRFPELKGRLLIMDMNEFVVYGIKDIDTKATGLTKEAALDYMAQHYVTEEMEDDKNISSCFVHDKYRHLETFFINDRINRSELNDVTPEAEAFILYGLDHELAHCALKDGISETNSLHGALVAETIADAYALIRHYQRFGVESTYHDKSTDPYARISQLIFQGSKTHFTAFVLDEIIKRRHQIDFDSLTPQQTATLARRFALEYMPSEPMIRELHQIFKPVRTAPKPRAEEGVKALIGITLDPKSDYHTFKLGSLWLDRFLETRTLPNGKTITLPEKYLDDVSKKLKERELKFAKEDILFNMPTIPPKPKAVTGRQMHPHKFTICK